MMALDNTSEGFKRAPRLVGVGIVAIYRAAISPVIHALNGPACRFEPSCSEYARDAIARHGMVRGGAMAIWRIARCNPVGGHGFDPVPSRADRIVSPARTDKEQNPESRSSAAFGPSPSSSPLQGEETESA
jgi:putative membrane protein insertion efficiency factor